MRQRTSLIIYHQDTFETTSQVNDIIRRSSRRVHAHFPFFLACQREEKKREKERRGRATPVQPLINLTVDRRCFPLRGDRSVFISWLTELLAADTGSNPSSSLDILANEEEKEIMKRGKTREERVEKESKELGSSLLRVIKRCLKLSFFLSLRLYLLSLFASSFFFSFSSIFIKFYCITMII